MIPKVAFFHWDGPPMNWLRAASIATFARHNPDWEIRVIRSLPGLNRGGLTWPHKADITWWHAMRDNGGFAVSTDIVFTKPVPAHWLEKPLCACLNVEENVNKGLVRQLAMIGCVKGHPAVSMACNIGMGLIDAAPFLDWQDLGVLLWHRVHDLLGDVCPQPMSALCHYDESRVGDLWNPQHKLELPDECIGVHWYGGHSTTRLMEEQVGITSNAPLAMLAVKEMRMLGWVPA